MRRALPLFLAACSLLALLPFAPAASATPCPENAGCPPPPLVCQPISSCIVISCNVLPTETVGAWAGFVGTSCFGGEAYACTTIAFTPPSRFLPPSVSCFSDTTIVIP